jgi:hypothetical protein
MFGFEITSDLLIFAILAQTIAFVLIILIIYFKIKKIQNRNIDLNEKIDEKLDRVESRLSYLYNQVLVISANQDKFNFPISSHDPSNYYRTKDTSNEESYSPSLLRNTILYGQNPRDSEMVDARLGASKLKESETALKAIDTATATNTITSSSPPSPSHYSFSEISTTNNPSDPAGKDPAMDFLQDNSEPKSTSGFADDDLPVERNTNPEIDKIEKEILTALKRLGGGDGYWDNSNVDGHDDNSSGREDVIYPTTGKTKQNSQNQ